jgi:hypothetical protein
LLQPGCDIDAIAIESFPLDNNIADVDANSKLHTSRLRKLVVARTYGVLNDDGGLDSVDRARELSEEIVAGSIDNATAVLRNQVGNESAVRH